MSFNNFSQSYANKPYYNIILSKSIKNYNNKSIHRLRRVLKIYEELVYEMKEKSSSYKCNFKILILKIVNGIT